MENVIYPDKPAAPEGPLTMSNLTATSADLEWKPPKTDGGSPITGYIIESKPSARASWNKVANVDSGTTRYTPKDLREGTEYYFRVSAVNEEGQGSPLESKEIVKPEKKIGKGKKSFYKYVIMIGNQNRSSLCGKKEKGCLKWLLCINYVNNSYCYGILDAPSSPSQFKVSKVGPDFVTLDWKPPSSDGGSKVTGYVVKQKKGPDGDWEEVATLKAFDTSYKVPKLKEDQEYFFSITALNKKGAGETSELDTAAVPKRPPGKSHKRNFLASSKVIDIFAFS